MPPKLSYTILTNITNKLRVGLFTCQVASIHVKPSGTAFGVAGGVGGTEAMIFANEIMNIYMKYFEHMRWPYRIEEVIESNPNVLRSSRVIIQSSEAFNLLIQEAGVHRVQRIPKTERHGRLHTSTVSIYVIPESILDVKLNERDIEVSTKRSSGPGGQHVNKTESAVRIVHRPTGIAVECQESRFQIDNKKRAMQKLLDKIQTVEFEKLVSSNVSMRKLQVGQMNRNEKIRTYNFPQDRITDHRINKSYHNLRRLFDGDVTVLEKIIHDLRNDKLAY